MVLEYEQGMRFLQTQEVRFNQVEKILGVRFRDRCLLRIALKPYNTRHWALKKSKGKRQTGRSYRERRQFQALALIGDSFLMLFLGQKILNGEELLETWSFDLVTNENLSYVFDGIEILQYLDLLPNHNNNGSKSINSHTRASIYEALVGAIFLDSGHEITYEFLKRTLLQKS